MVGVCAKLDYNRAKSRSKHKYCLSPVIILTSKKLNTLHRARNVEFIDLKTQAAMIESSIQSNIQKVLNHGRFIMGPEIAQLEEKLASFVGIKHAIGISSGTDALLVAMMALDVQPGDEVITTPFTFIATGEMIALLGAVPVFVDIDPKTYNIDPVRIEEAITNKTKAIVPVSVYGQCVDMDAINAVAEKHGVPVIEDGAQSLGGTYKGKQSCSMSTISCTSFFPSKPLGCYGDGGMCFTNDDALNLSMRQIKNHGQDRRYHHPRLGLNGRLDTIQAAVLLAKMEIFEEEVKLRNKIGQRYTKLIQENCMDVITPFIRDDCTSVYAQYTILVNGREQVCEKLNKAGIPTAVHYPVPLHKQPVFNCEANVPVAEEIASKVMSLPMHPYLDNTTQEQIVEALKLALR